MPQQLYPVPASAFISEYPTPDIRDYFVWERKDPSKPNYEVPNYGDLFPDAGKYPNHRFVRSIPEKDGGYVLHVYAAEREDQEEYNHVVSYPYGGNTAFPRYVRTYLTLREDYAAVALGTADVEFTDAVLVDQEMLRLEDSVLDSLFVLERRTYEIIPDLDVAGDLAEAIKFGYKVEYPYGVHDYPRVTWTIPCDSETAATPLTATCPIVGYRDTVGEIQSPPMYLIDQTYMREKQQIIGLTRVYERNPGPIIYESEYEPRTGRLIQISKQIVASTSVPATAALLDAEVNGYTSVALTSVVNGLATTGAAHGLSVGQEIYISGATLGGSAAFINGTSGGTGAYYVKTVDSSTTFTFASTPAGAAFSNANDDAAGGTLYKRTLARGTIIEYRPMNMDKLRSIQIVSKIPLDAIDYLNGAADKVYETIQNYGFPDTLTAAGFYWAEAWNAAGHWDFDLSLYAKIKDGYRGPCRAIITERYTSNPAAPAFLASLPSVTTFSPEAIAIPVAYYYASSTTARSFARTFTIPPTLHANLTLTDTGSSPTNDTGGSHLTTTGATTPTGITAGTSYTISIDPSPWRFGVWLYRMTTIIAPSW